jgi:hypothetical protein
MLIRESPSLTASRPAASDFSFAVFLPYGDIDCCDEANCRGEFAIARGNSCAILRIAENEMSEDSGESRMKLAVNQPNRLIFQELPLPTFMKPGRFAGHRIWVWNRLASKATQVGASLGELGSWLKVAKFP